MISHTSNHAHRKKKKKKGKINKEKDLSLVWTDHKPLGVFRIRVCMHIHTYVKYKCIYTHKHI